MTTLRTTHLAPALGSALGALLWLGALGAALPGTARADAGGPWYGGVGVGPWQYLDWGGFHFRVSGEIGWHPSGRDEGFFLGLDVTTSLWNRSWHFQTGLRLGGDIEVWHNRDVALLLVPAGMVGLGILDWDDRDRGGDAGFFLLQPSFGVALAVANRLVHIFVRPLVFDLMFFPDYPGTRRFEFDWAYSALGGVHFTFG